MNVPSRYLWSRYCSLRANKVHVAWRSLVNTKFLYFTRGIPEPWGDYDCRRIQFGNDENKLHVMTNLISLSSESNFKYPYTHTQAPPSPRPFLHFTELQKFHLMFSFYRFSFAWCGSYVIQVLSWDESLQLRTFIISFERKTHFHKFLLWRWSLFARWDTSTSESTAQTIDCFWKVRWNVNRKYSQRVHNLLHSFTQEHHRLTLLKNMTNTER